MGPDHYINMHERSEDEKWLELKIGIDTNLSMGIANKDFRLHIDTYLIRCTSIRSNSLLQDCWNF